MTILFETVAYNNTNEEVSTQLIDWMVVQIPLHPSWTHVKTVDGALRNSSVSNATRREIFKCTGAGVAYGNPFDFYIGVSQTTSETALHFQMAEDFDDVADEWFNPAPTPSSHNNTTYATNADGGLGWRAVTWGGMWQVSTAGGYLNYGTTAGTAHLVIRDDGIYIGSLNNHAEYLGIYEPLVDYRSFVDGDRNFPTEVPPLLASNMNNSTTSTTGPGTMLLRGSVGNLSPGNNYNFKRRGPGAAIWTTNFGTQIPDGFELFTGKVLASRVPVYNLSTSQAITELYGAVNGLFVDLLTVIADAGVTRMDTVTLDGVKWMVVANLGNTLLTPIEEPT